MKFKEINKILYPVYIYIILFGIYYLYLTKLLYQFNSGLLTDILFYSFLIFIPLIILVFINIKLNKLNKKKGYLSGFLFSSTPGLISGAWLGYGMYGVFFSTTINGFFQAILLIGLFGALTTGIIGSILNLVFRKFTK